MTPLDLSQFEEVPAGAAPAAAAPAAGGALDMSQFEEAGAAPRPQRSQLESGARGAVQGATFGFADEISGLLESAFTDKTYRQARDESRQAFREAKEDNPWTYGIAEVGAGIGSAVAVPAGALARVGLGGAKGAAALAGAAGAGASEAEDLGGVAKDAGMSAALGGVTSKLTSKLIQGAPERVIKRTVGDLTDGAPAGVRDRLVGKATAKAGGEPERLADVIGVVKKYPALRKASGDPAAQLTVVDDALKQTGSRLDDIYAKAGKSTPGIKVSEILGEVEDIANALAKDPGKVPLAEAVRGQADNILNVWGNRTHVSASEVRTLAGDIAKSAFRGSPAVEPTMGRAVAQDVWGSLKDLIGRNIDDSAKAIGEGGRKELQALNREMGVLLNIQAAATHRATRMASPSTRLKDQIGGVADLGLLAASPTAFVGKKALELAGKPAARVADDALAQLAAAARAGSSRAQLAQRAAELGLAPAVGEGVYAWYATNVRPTIDLLSGPPAE